MTNKVSLDKSKIKFVLLEGVHQSALDTLHAAGYTNIDFYKKALDGDELKEAIKDAHFIGLRSRTQLTAEMIEYIEHDIPNIICVQPFACLPNHVVGKGVIKTIREKYPDANISPVDYDPGASEANQTNRIKLLMTVAKDNLKTKQNRKSAIEAENAVNNIETIKN